MTRREDSPPSMKSPSSPHLVQSPFAGPLQVPPSPHCAQTSHSACLPSEHSVLGYHPSWQAQPVTTSLLVLLIL